MAQRADRFFSRWSIVVAGACAAIGLLAGAAAAQSTGEHAESGEVASGRERGTGTGSVVIAGAPGMSVPAPRSSLRPAEPATGPDAQGGPRTLLVEEFELAAWPSGSTWQVFDDNGAVGGEYRWENRCTGYQSSRSAWAIGGGAQGDLLGTCSDIYPSQLDSWMVIGPFDLSGATSATLSFTMWLNSECVGTDCASKVDPLWAVASTNGSQFNGRWWAGDWKDDAGALAGGWWPATLDLAAYVGEPRVWIGFNFVSDASVGYPGGAFLDDVRLTAVVPCDPVLSVQQMTVSAPCYRPGSTVGVFLDVASTGGTREVEAWVSIWSGDVIWVDATRRFSAPGQQLVELVLPSSLSPGTYRIYTSLTQPGVPDCVHDTHEVTITVDPTCNATDPVPVTATPTRTPTPRATLEAGLCPGESVDETKTIHIPAAPARADVLFAFDTTGSMGPVLDSAKANAVTIMNNLAAVIPDIQFGVVDLRDYPLAPYGDPGDWPYLLRQPITNNRSGISAAIAATSAGGGNDGPEAYSRALHETNADAEIRWRPDARHFIVMFGDNVPHDDDLNAGIAAPPVDPGGTWCGGSPTGCVLDPGRDGVPGTRDDLDFQTVLAQVAAQRSTLLFVVSGGGDWQTTIAPYWREWARMTNPGGDAVSLADAVQLPAAIQNLITSAGRRIARLELRANPPQYQDWLTVTPPDYTDLVVPPEGRSVTFDVRIRVPMGTEPGTYAFSVDAVGDGAVYGGQTVTINVPTDCTPMVTPTPTPTPYPCPPLRPSVTPVCITSDMARNPGFEHGPRGWCGYSTAGRSVVGIDRAITGFRSALFTSASAETTDEWLYQFVDIPPDAESASFWVDDVRRFVTAVNPPAVSAGNFFRASIYDLTMSTELVRLWEFDPLLPVDCAIDPSTFNLTSGQLAALRGRTVVLVFRFQKVTRGWVAGVIVDRVHFTVCSPSPPCRVVGDKTASPRVVPAGGEATVAIRLTGLDGLCNSTRTPADVALVMDTSGSMAEADKLVMAKLAAKGFVDTLEPGVDQVALVSFSDDASVKQVLSPYAGGIRGAIDVLSPVGDTNIAAAIARARDELGSARHRPANGRALVLLSDGLPTVGGDPRAEAAAAKAEGIRVFTIGLGNDVDPALMRELASAPSDYFFAPGAEQLAGIYAQISGLIGGGPATNIELVDRLSQYVALVPGSFTGPYAPAVSVDGRTLTWRIPRLGLETLILTYRVRLTEAAGTWPANDSAVASYTNSRGEPATLVLPVPMITVLAPAADHPEAMCRDHSRDGGSVPTNAGGEPVWDSPDIWVRQSDDRGSQHQNPLVGQPNMVYVRVHNVGDAPLRDIVVHVYDADGGANLRWPDDWAPEIGRTTIANLAPGATTVVGVPWTPVYPGHTCFLVRLEAPQDPITFDGYVPFDNNICQKNVQVTTGGGGGHTPSSVNVGTRERGSGYGSVRITSKDLAAGATGRIGFGSRELFDRWQLAGGTATGGTVDAGERTVTFRGRGTGGGAVAAQAPDLALDLMLDRLPFEPEELAAITLEVTDPAGGAPATFQIEQFMGGRSTGGVTVRPVEPSGLFVPYAGTGKLP